MLRDPWPRSGIAFGHRHAAMRPVHVQVLHDDQLGAGRGRAGQDAALERRELLRPAVVVGRVGAVVDVARARAHAARVGRLGRVPAHHLDGLGQRAPRSAARDDADPLSLREQCFDDGQADRSVAEHDVELARRAHADRHRSQLRRGVDARAGSTRRMSRITPTAISQSAQTR